MIATFGVGQLGSAGQARQFGGVARPELITLPSYTPPAGGPDPVGRLAAPRR